jgi:hypothetical protein
VKGNARFQVPGGLVRLATGAIFAVGLALVSLSAPARATAADDVVEVVATTYSVEPERARIRVTVGLSITNRIPDAVSLVPCTRWEFDPYIGWYTLPDVCPRTTRYYLTQTYVWVESGARNLTVKADRGTVKWTVTSRDDGFVTYRLDFSPIYRNQTRKVTVAYEIVGGPPRSASRTRLGQAYLSFCASAHGASTELDSETVKIIVPAAFEVDVVPSPLPASSAQGSTVLVANLDGSEATAFYRCLSGTNDAALHQTTLVSASAVPIRVLSWPEDDEWRAAVGGMAKGVFDALVDLIGRPPPTSAMTIRETAGGLLGEYAGFFETESGTAYVSEDYGQPGLLAHEMAHAWFDEATFGSRWMYEGLAEWAAVEVSGPSTDRCDPPPYPGLGTLDLDDWPILGPRATEADRQRVDALYDEACSLFDAIAERAGSARMRDALEALFLRRPAYDDGGPGRNIGQPIDWRYVLDVIDERALVPAGIRDLEFAEGLFVRFGVASRDELIGRAAARAAYHRLVGDLDRWSMPAVIPRALEDWQFEAARSMISSVAEAWSQVQAADALVPGLGAADGPVGRAVETARSAEDLVRAADLATQQRKAAEVVLAARDALGRSRDPLEELGLVGTDLAALERPIMGAAARADLDAARAGLAALEAVLGEARRHGMLRLLAGAVPLVLLLFLGGWFVRRRRRHIQAQGAMSVVALPSPVDGVSSTDMAPGAPAGGEDDASCADPRGGES